MSTNPVVIERIRKCLARAKDQKGSPEGEVAARIAHNLMVEHAISQEDLDFAERQKTDPLIMEVVDIGARCAWRREVYFAIASHCTLRSLFWPGTTRIKLFGHAHDIEVAKYLFEIVARQLEHVGYWYVRGPEFRFHSASEKRAIRHSFSVSAVEGFRTKLAQIRKENAARREKSVRQTSGEEAAPTTVDSTALVMKAREEKVKDFYHANSGKVRSSRGGGGYGRNFSLDGFNAGRNVSLTPALQNKRKALK